METVEITLPSALRAYLQDQIGRGRFADASDFMRTMLRKDRDAFERLDEILQDGIDSGISDLSFDEIIAEARERHRSRAA